MLNRAVLLSVWIVPVAKVLGALRGNSGFVKETLPEDRERPHDRRLTEFAKPTFTSVSPREGSLEGGQNITILGTNLFKEADTMTGGDDGDVSSLQPKLRIFLGMQECQLDHFASKPNALYCETQPVNVSNGEVPEAWQAITIQKLTSLGYQTVEWVPGAGEDPEARFRFTGGATPELADVTPSSAGPGDVLTIQAWTCDGTMTSDKPILLVPLDPAMEAGEGAGEGADGGDGMSAYGHACDYWPLKDVSTVAGSVAAEALAEASTTNLTAEEMATIGDHGLEGRLYEYNPQPLQQFLQSADLYDSRRWIQETLSYAQSAYHWLGTSSPFIAHFVGFLEVPISGMHAFRLECWTECFAKISSMDLCNDNGECTAQKQSYHGYQVIDNDNFNLTAGFHRIEIGHRLEASYTSRFNFQYMGPGVDSWTVPPPEMLKAGISHRLLDALAQEKGAKNKTILMEPTMIFDELEATSQLPCPGNLPRRRVQFQCLTPADLEPGVYAVKFFDHVYGASAEGSSSQFRAKTIGGATVLANLRILPKIHEVQKNGSALLVRGLGLDHLPGNAGYNGELYTVTHATQDEVLLTSVDLPSGSTYPFGAPRSRGLLRTTWPTDTWPEEQTAEGAIMRATKLRQGVDNHTGFSERLEGRMVPPYSGSCQFVVQEADTGPWHNHRRRRTTGGSWDTGKTRLTLTLNGDNVFPMVQTPTYLGEGRSQAFQLNAGHEYGFRLDRRVDQWSRESTSVDGWQRLGLHCSNARTLEPNAEDLPVPKRQELLIMRVKDWKVQVQLSMNMPNRSYSLQLASGPALTASAATVHARIVDLFGPTCTMSTITSSDLVADFEEDIHLGISEDAYCGFGRFAPNFDISSGNWMSKSITALHTTDSNGDGFVLSDKPWLSMCYAMGNTSIVNIAVECRIPGADHVAQFFSIGIQDPDMTLYGGHQGRNNYGLAAVWSGLVADNAWHCASMNLLNQVLDYEAYSRRFAGINYNSNTGEQATKLAGMKISRIFFRSGMEDVYLKGSFRADELTVSASEVSVTRAPPAVQPAPFERVQVLPDRTLFWPSTPDGLADLEYVLGSVQVGTFDAGAIAEAPTNASAISGVVTLPDGYPPQSASVTVTHPAYGSSATFDIQQDSGAQIAAKIMAAGLPVHSVEKILAAELHWLQLTGAEVTVGHVSQTDTRDEIQNPENVVDGDPETCAAAFAWSERWLKINLGGITEVRAVRILVKAGREIAGIGISLDEGHTFCQTGLTINGDGGAVELLCAGTASYVLIKASTNSAQFDLCEVGVAVEGAHSPTVLPSQYMLRVSTAVNLSESSGGLQFTSPSLIDSTSIEVESEGGLFFSKLTDDWFQLPDDPEGEAAVAFGDGRDFICAVHRHRASTDSGWNGCAPNAAEGSLERRLQPTVFDHTARRLAPTTRRQPMATKWRRPSRYHTPETLEKLRRSVLGAGTVQGGWDATRRLMDTARTEARRLRSSERSLSGVLDVDPRNDPNALIWSSPASWGGENPPTRETADIVYIPEGLTTRLDVDVFIRFWVIEGNVVWAMDRDMHMEAEAIVVNGGKLLIGSEQNPYLHQGRITFHGHWHSMKLPLCGIKTLFETRGSVEMHGRPIAKTWTALSQTLYPGDSVMHLMEEVTWQPGDLIVIAPSDAVPDACRLDRRDGCQAEERYVQQVQGSTVVLDRPVQYRHVGEEIEAPGLSTPAIGSVNVAPHCQERPELCRKTQVRSEVGLLTRNIKVKGSNFDDGSGPPGSEGFGAHLMHAEHAAYTYVEFYWMGQAFQMGRYPLHLHLTGLNPDSKIVGCAIHRTFQRGITVHGTFGSLIKDNVLYNHMSHGYFIEDGNEHANIFENNLGMLTHRSLSMLSSDQTPATFWIRNPQNSFIGNHAAGSASFGFWFDTLGAAVALEIPIFFNNTAHSNGFAGIWIDFVDPRQGCFAPNEWTIQGGVSYNPPTCGGFKRKNTPLESTTTWGNSLGIVINEVGHLHFLNHRSMSDGVGLLAWGIVSDNWADASNGWYGPAIMHSVYHATERLAEPLLPNSPSCNIGGPWDDGLFITGVQFDGPASRAGFCPCFFCNGKEGGYEMRTSALGWHNGAGAGPISGLRASWVWPMSSFFFDFDGTLTEDTEACRYAGCYLHSAFQGPSLTDAPDLRAGTYLEVGGGAYGESSPGGLAFLPPHLCHEVVTGGIVCARESQLQAVTVRSFGHLHGSVPFMIYTDWGFAEAPFTSCRAEYQVSVFKGIRHTIVPPPRHHTPEEIRDFGAEIKLRAGDAYVLQFRTNHDPDGFRVSQYGISKNALIDNAPVKYGPEFYDAGYIWQQAHIPLINTAEHENSAGNWGYLPARPYSTGNWSWSPGTFSLLVTGKGIAYSMNHVGLWDGLPHSPLELLSTRPFNTGAQGAGPGRSHIHTALSWQMYNEAELQIEDTPTFNEATSRLETLVRYCDVRPGAFGHVSASALQKVNEHAFYGGVGTATVKRFNWSSMVENLWTPPTWIDDDEGLGNITIEADWEVTLDQDVVFVNKLSVLGVLRFADRPGCCKLAARYIAVGPFFGRLEAGTEAQPFVNGFAHIILKGHPLTPQLKSFEPHIVGSAKWMNNKFIAVQGELSLFGQTRTRTWTRLAQGAAVGQTYLVLEECYFQAGDIITIDNGLERRNLTSVNALTRTVYFDEPLGREYRGADHLHLGRSETRGLMAAHVGLVEGHTVVVEGEDTPGIPVCSVSAEDPCPYSEDNLQGAIALAEMVTDVRCRPCLALSEQRWSGYIIAMGYFHRFHTFCPAAHGAIQVSGVAFKHASSIHLYHSYNGGNYPESGPKDFEPVWNDHPHKWWTDPVWPELDAAAPALPSHKITKSSFVNVLGGTAFALTTSGVYVFPTEPVTHNVLLFGGAALNGHAFAYEMNPLYHRDVSNPQNDNTEDRGAGVGANRVDGIDYGLGKFTNPATPEIPFEYNFLSGAKLTSLHDSPARYNVITNKVWLAGSSVSASAPSPFRDNIVSGGGSDCIRMWTSGKKGVSDNVVYGCDVCVAFRQNTVANGVLARMKLLDCNLGIQYFTAGADGKDHDDTRSEFEAFDTKIYARADGSGSGVHNPKVHAEQQGETPTTDWMNAGPKRDSFGQSAVTLYHRSLLRNITFVGFDNSVGGYAIAMGAGGVRDTSDGDFHPIFFRQLAFVDMPEASRLSTRPPWGVGWGTGACIQFNCDGMRNFLVVDEDGTLLGQPGTVVPSRTGMYDKMGYVDPMGFENMEDLIPMPARYDRFGDAIPFPTNVSHGYGGGLEYECISSTGCPVYFMEAGYWIPHDGLLIGMNERVVATVADGAAVGDQGLARLDPIHHGWQYAAGHALLTDLRQTMDPADTPKPESQHARRYGRVGPGEFGTHINTSRVGSTSGPVYQYPGVYQIGCTEDHDWQAFRCPGGQHRHLVVEVMDWNHLVRRWAPISVEVNNEGRQQGGALNVFTGPAMYITGNRLQTFHALGHCGMRHNVYFTADPPQHLRLHLQYADPSCYMIVCVYYGIPNSVVGYLNGQEMPPLTSITWDNLAMPTLNGSMPHGTYFYDRVGAETGRPGYLYALLKGSSNSVLDLKISHRVTLTTRVTVDAQWGGWNEENTNNFYATGINGLVRNIALLIGAPESRVAILGTGTAEAGTFWNEDTTSREFAQWMWQQNQSLDSMSQEQWGTAPGSRRLMGSAFPSLSRSKPSPALWERLHLDAYGNSSGSSTGGQEDLGNFWKAVVGRRLQSHGPTGQAAMDVRLVSDQVPDAPMCLNESLDDCGVFEDHSIKQSQVRLENGTAHSMESGLAAFNAPFAIILNGSSAGGSGGGGGGSDAGGGGQCVAITQSQLDHFTSYGWRPASCDGSTVPTRRLTRAQVSASRKSARRKPAPKPARRLTTASQAQAQPSLVDVSVDDVQDMHAPLGWSCAETLYNDGSSCDCDCGVWDPDCDRQSEVVNRVPVIHYGKEYPPEVLDTEMATTAIRALDIDGNRNHLIDGDEDLRFFQFLDVGLGDTSLPGMASKIIDASRLSPLSRKEHLMELRLRPGQERLGDFAWLNAVEAPSCQEKLNSTSYQSELLISQRVDYFPVCVKDPYFALTAGEVSGRCAYRPVMRPGSQCETFDGNTRVQGSGSNSSFSPSAVCNYAASSRRRYASNPGLTTAKLYTEGKEDFTRTYVDQSSRRRTSPLPPGEPLEVFQPDGSSLEDMTWSTTDGFSVYAEIVPRTFHNSPRIFDMMGQTYTVWAGNYDVRYGTQKASFFRAYVGGNDPFRGSLERGNLTLDWINWHWSHAQGEWVQSLSIPNAVEKDKLNRLLFTVGRDWIMKIYRDGEVLGFFQLARDPEYRIPEEIWIGKALHSNWGNMYPEQFNFEGSIQNVRIWDHEVTWGEAEYGKLPGETISDAVRPVQEAVIPCIPSAENSWDFYCNNILPDMLADKYGIPRMADSATVTRFQSQLDLGELATCGAAQHASSVIFNVRTGEGISAEFYQFSGEGGVNLIKCTPFADISGHVPVSVQTHTTVNYTAMGEFLIQWTAQLQVTIPGDYTFYLTRANGGAWLGIDGHAIVWHSETRCYAGNSCCPDHYNEALVEHSGSVYLTSGLHDFRMIYYNRKHQYNGTVRVQYEGPDNNFERGYIATSNFILREERQTTGAANESLTVLPGYFVYDAATDLAVMAAGSCDLQCRRGNFRQAALVFNMFCRTTTTVRFTAEVAQGARTAQLWVDSAHILVWTLTSTGPDNFNASIVTRSALSPAVELSAGDHSIAFQGRPSEFAAFGFRRLFIEEGGESCELLIDGAQANEC